MLFQVLFYHILTQIKIKNQVNNFHAAKQTGVSDVMKQQFLELLHWQWMPDRLYGSETVPTDQVSKEGSTFTAPQLLAALWNNAH